MVFDIVSQSGILASSMNEIDFSSIWNSENTRERKKLLRIRLKTRKYQGKKSGKNENLKENKK